MVKITRPTGNLATLLEFIDEYITKLSNAHMVAENVSDSNSKAVKPKTSDSALHTAVESEKKSVFVLQERTLY